MKGWIAGKESEETNVQREVNRIYMVSVFVLVSVRKRLFLTLSPPPLLPLDTTHGSVQASTRTTTSS